MKGTPISDLTIHSLDGEFYGLFRNYLEKHGCTWTDSRVYNQLQSVYLQFPPGTTYVEKSSSGDYERRQITLPDGGIFFWLIRRASGQHSITVPYVYL